MDAAPKPPAPPPADGAPDAAPDPVCAAIAEACETAFMAACKASPDVAAAAPTLKKLVLEFADDGSVSVDADGAKADVDAAAMGASDPDADPNAPPPMAA